MIAPLLAISDLRVGAKPDIRAVDGVSFSMAPGEILALVGESGSGKTAMARAVIGLLPSGLAVTGGRIDFAGAPLTPAALRPLRGPGIGMVFQEPMTSLNPALPIGVQMAEGLALHTRLRGAEIAAACRAMLDRVGIADPTACLRAFPHEFSGGMRQRIMLASVMLLRPRLLIADEPTTALDTLTQAEVLDLMVGLTREQGSAVLLITHNLGLVARYADRALVMRRGRVIEEGAARALLAAPRESYTRALVDALPRRGPPATPRPPSEPLLRAEALAVDFAGRRRFFARSRAVQAVRGVDLAVHAGESVALVGGSGSGKTTLGRAMLRLVPASGGRVLFRGQDITAVRGAALLPFRLACQIVFQDPYSSLDPRMRIAEIVDEPLRLVPGLGAAERARRTDAMLDAVGLADFGRRHPHELSGGQRQRVAIARALVREPAFVMADEPVSALDMTIQKQILTLLRDLQRARGFACLFISHDLAAVGEIADRVVVMQEGRIVEEGSRDAVFDAPRHAYTRALLDAAPGLEALVA
ncbi:dipeptide ABC transporter ATP-binding protein [Plastoroseomonas hellenica]|uniref:dipeptide ABC transporter ATP-binding protein n=1 Tax=Plastoroseomonas hellenica TaxID=2687306 RepID=UPI001BA64736|nr:ABC transporter ATP-binding protein [Plastoroseomonas hellenica]MBR0642317.1 ABC transporter ATP-binding protein [Plastoroseomonas hellenica]